MVTPYKNMKYDSAREGGEENNIIHAILCSPWPPRPHETHLVLAAVIFREIQAAKRFGFPEGEWCIVEDSSAAARTDVAQEFDARFENHLRPRTNIGSKPYIQGGKMQTGTVWW